MKQRLKTLEKLLTEIAKEPLQYGFSRNENRFFRVLKPLKRRNFLLYNRMYNTYTEIQNNKITGQEDYGDVPKE